MHSIHIKQRQFEFVNGKDMDIQTRSKGYVQLCTGENLIQKRTLRIGVIAIRWRLEIMVIAKPLERIKVA